MKLSIPSPQSIPAPTASVPGSVLRSAAPISICSLVIIMALSMLGFMAGKVLIGL